MSSFSVVDHYHSLLPQQPEPGVAAMLTLTSLVAQSAANTVMGLMAEVESAIEAMRAAHPSCIALQAGCQLFARHISRTAVEEPDVSSCVKRVTESGLRLPSLPSRARAAIATHVQLFLNHQPKILLHGYSQVVVEALVKAHERGAHCSLIITEGRPNCDGYRLCNELGRAGIPCTLIVDSAIGYVMERVAFVLSGAEGLAESGGVINKIGTYALCVMAQAYKRPVYVCAEAYKFARLFPLRQRDLTESRDRQLPFTPVQKADSNVTHEFPDDNSLQPSASLPASHHFASYTVSPEPIHPFVDASLIGDTVDIENPAYDYVPSHLISLLFTDLGILTPSAISDALIQLSLNPQ